MGDKCLCKNLARRLISHTCLEHGTTVKDYFSRSLNFEVGEQLKAL